MFSLNANPLGYQLTNADLFKSVITGISGVPYAMRHLEEAYKAEVKWGHRTIAVLESIPVLGALCALIERVVNYLTSEKTPLEKYRDDNEEIVEQPEEDETAAEDAAEIPKIELDQTLLDDPKKLIATAASPGTFLYYKDYETIRLHMHKLAEQGYKFEGIDQLIFQAVLGTLDIEEFQKLSEEERCKIYFVANRFQHKELVERLKEYTPKGEDVYLKGYAASPSNANIQETEENIAAFLKDLRKEGCLLKASEFVAHQEEINAKIDRFLESAWNSPPVKDSKIDVRKFQTQLSDLMKDIKAEFAKDKPYNINLMAAEVIFRNFSTVSSDIVNFKSIVKKVGARFRRIPKLNNDLKSIKKMNGLGIYIKERAFLERIQGKRWIEEVVKEQNLDIFKVPYKILIVDDSQENINVCQYGDTLKIKDEQHYCFVAQRVNEIFDLPDETSYKLTSKARKQMEPFTEHTYYSDFYGKNFMWHHDGHYYCIDTEANSFTFPKGEAVKNPYQMLTTPYVGFAHQISAKRVLEN